MSLLHDQQSASGGGSDKSDPGPAELQERYGWLFAPGDMHDPEAWNKYWKGQLEHDIGPELVDMFCKDDHLVTLMRRHTLRSVLCVGNGISQEPKALQALANRLATPGVFFSHCHDGGWMPPADPRHVTGEWFRDQGWKIYGHDSHAPLGGRVAYLSTSTG